MWLLKTIVTVLGEIIATYHKLQGILLLLINLGLLWIVVRNVPYYNAAVNCFQGALYTLLTWQALILFALVWDDSWAEVRTTAQSAFIPVTPKCASMESVPQCCEQCCEQHSMRGAGCIGHASGIQDLQMVLHIVYTSLS